jgi:hypothetical protein
MLRDSFVKPLPLCRGCAIYPAQVWPWSTYERCASCQAHVRPVVLPPNNLTSAPKHFPVPRIPHLYVTRSILTPEGNVRPVSYQQIAARSHGRCDRSKPHMRVERVRETARACWGVV